MKKIMMCCRSSCEPDSEPTGVSEEIFGWTRWFLLEGQFCSLAMLPLCFSFCWERVTRRNVPLCSELTTLEALCALLASPGLGVSFSASSDALELFLCCSVGFFEAELSISVVSFKEKNKTPTKPNQFDLKSLFKRRQQRDFCQQPASLALSEGTNTSRVLFVPGTVGLIPAVSTWLERGLASIPRQK